MGDDERKMAEDIRCLPARCTGWIVSHAFPAGGGGLLCSPKVHLHPTSPSPNCGAEVSAALSPQASTQSYERECSSHASFHHSLSFLYWGSSRVPSHAKVHGRGQLNRPSPKNPLNAVVVVHLFQSRNPLRRCSCAKPNSLVTSES